MSTAEPLPSPDSFPRAQDNASNSSAPSQWIGFVVFGTFVALMTMFFGALFMRQTQLRRMRHDATVFDPEASARGFDSRIRINHYPQNNAEEQGQTYKQLRADASEMLPDQSGRSVECVICLEGFQNDSLVRVLPCHHFFHAGCIADWFQRHHDTCPICKAHNVNPQHVEALPTVPPRVMLPF